MLIKILLLTGILSTISTNNIVTISDNGTSSTITHRDATTTNVLTAFSEFLDYPMMKQVTDINTGQSFIVNRDFISSISPLSTGSRIQLGGTRVAIADVEEDINYILDYSSNLTGEIKIIATAAIPNGWLECDGRSLDTISNQSLFKAIGYAFGGTGANFNLPDMRGRTFTGVGDYTTISGSIINYTLGQVGGASSVALTEAQMPSHSHDVRVISTRGAISSPVNNFISDADPFDGDFGNTAPDTTLNPASISEVGKGEAHENRSPFSTFTIIIKE